jgi:predicted nucleic-acid-binding protein
MIGLDTNVVIRYLVLDDPIQAAAAEKLIDSLSVEETGFISLIVITEIVWVLRSSYRYKKAEIVSVLEMLLQTRELVVEQGQLVADALRRFSDGGADFIDYLIELCAQAAGCAHTFTFDQTAASAAGMRLLR